MNTTVMKMTEDNLNADDLIRAAKVLRCGGLVAFPTETVYGLGGDALNREAANKIYEAKGRPSDNPLIIHIADRDSLAELVREIPEKAQKLADKFWPGPLTMIFHKGEKVPYTTTGGLDTVAVRMPAHDIALALIRRSGVFLAAPSANTSGRPSPTAASHVIEDLSGKVDVIIDGGAVGIGLESTIVDMTEKIPIILRPGYITKEMLEAVIGEVRSDKEILPDEKDRRPRAPGMKYKHYAPKGELIIIEGGEQEVAALINQLAAAAHLDGKTVGVIATSETKAYYKNALVKSIGTRKEEESIARGLYAVLREFDEAGADIIYGESFRSNGLGQAIMNRLLKAAGHRMIKADGAGEF